MSILLTPEAVRLTARFGVCGGVAFCRAVGLLSGGAGRSAADEAMAFLVEIDRSRGHLGWFGRALEKSGNLLSAARCRRATRRLGEGLLASRGGGGIPGIVLPGEIRMEETSALREAVRGALALLPRIARAGRRATGRILSKPGPLLRGARAGSGPSARAGGSARDARRREACHLRRGFVAAVSDRADLLGLYSVLEKELAYALSFAEGWLAEGRVAAPAPPRHLVNGEVEAAVETPRGVAVCRLFVERGEPTRVDYEPPPAAFVETPRALVGLLP